MTADELITQRFLEQEEQIKKLKKEINQKIAEKNDMVRMLTMCTKLGDCKLLNDSVSLGKQFGFIVKISEKTFYDHPEYEDLATQYMRLLKHTLELHKEDKLIDEEE